MNDRYVQEFVEEYGFCPFAKRGRRLGQIHRYVHFAHAESVTELTTLMHRITSDPSQVVVQVVLPLIEIGPREWHRFVTKVSEFANFDLPRDDRMGTAALHLTLTYTDANPFSMLTLFRRSPNPTIQWVRLHGVRKLYEGRSGGTRVMTLADMDTPLAKPPMTPLYDRIAITNARMARRMRLETIEAMLAEYADDATRSYQRILWDHLA